MLRDGDGTQLRNRDLVTKLLQIPGEEVTLQAFEIFDVDVSNDLVDLQGRANSLRLLKNPEIVDVGIFVELPRGVGTLCKHHLSVQI